MRFKSLNIAITTLAVISGISTVAYAGTGAGSHDGAKLTMQQARSEALNQVNGTIKSAELEKEGGGSGLRYSFDIQTSQGIREVGIDAVSGKVLENSRESAHAETQEAKDEHEQSSNSPNGETEDHDQDRNGTDD